MSSFFLAVKTNLVFFKMQHDDLVRYSTDYSYLTSVVFLFTEQAIDFDTQKDEKTWSQTLLSSEWAIELKSKTTGGRDHLNAHQYARHNIVTGTSIRSIPADNGVYELSCSPC